MQRKSLALQKVKCWAKNSLGLVIPSKGSKANHKVPLIQELKSNSLSKKHFGYNRSEEGWRRVSYGFVRYLCKIEKIKTCLLAIIRDISEQVQMEASLKQERDMLEDINREHRRRASYSGHGLPYFMDKQLHEKTPTAISTGKKCFLNFQHIRQNMSTLRSF